MRTRPSPPVGKSAAWKVGYVHGIRGDSPHPTDRQNQNPDYFKGYERGGALQVSAAGNRSRMSGSRAAASSY